MGYGVGDALAATAAASIARPIWSTLSPVRSSPPLRRMVGAEST